MATAAYIAAECLVSMSSRAIVHGPRENGDGSSDYLSPNASLPGKELLGGRRPLAGRQTWRRHNSSHTYPAGSAQMPLRGLRKGLRQVVPPEGSP
uniref:Uncharacterized protein n=1 Tax=Anolis carolinensis TaxID=28377 RepID=A0A803SQL0_ANOCA